MRTSPILASAILLASFAPTIPACAPVDPEQEIAWAEYPAQEGPQAAVYAPCAYCSAATQETIEKLAWWCGPESAGDAGVPAAPVLCPNATFTACPVPLENSSCEWIGVVDGQHAYCCPTP